MDFIEPIQFQKVIVQLQENQIVNWNDPKDPIVSQISGMGRMLCKFPCKGGYVLLMLMHDFIKIESEDKPVAPTETIPTEIPSPVSEVVSE